MLLTRSPQEISSSQCWLRARLRGRQRVLRPRGGQHWCCRVSWDGHGRCGGQACAVLERRGGLSLHVSHGNALSLLCELPFLHLDARVLLIDILDEVLDVSCAASTNDLSICESTWRRVGEYALGRMLQIPHIPIPHLPDLRQWRAPLPVRPCLLVHPHPLPRTLRCLLRPDPPLFPVNFNSRSNGMHSSFFQWIQFFS